VPRSYRAPRFFKGQHLAADDLQALSDGLEELRRARTAGPLSRGTAGGVADLRPRRWLAKIVASGVVSSKTFYSWQAVYETAAGVYSNLDLSFSGKWNAENPAYERNGNTAVPAGTIVEMEWDPTTALARFFYTSPATATTQVYPVKAPAGGIAALSGTTPGSGSCTLYVWSGGSFAATGGTVTVRNPYSSAVGANKLLWVADWSGATWVVSESCT
jgi:hypothetical protein